MKFIILTIFLIASINSQLAQLNDPNIQAAVNIGNNPTPLSTSCGIPDPKVSTDCTKKNTVTEFCCFMESTTTPTTTAPFCKPIGPTDYLPSMSTWKVNGTDYKINCDIVSGTIGTPCGTVGPKTLADCAKADTTANSCCWYHNEKTKIDYCFWAGMKMSGSIIETVQCNSSGFLSLSAILAIALFLF
jgi:hypothetical protein